MTFFVKVKGVFMERITDMTKGSISKQILTFAFPLILTNLGQHLYMIVDAAIVGRGVGVKALAAVGAADWSYWLILWAVVGITQAFATFISRHFGCNNYTAMNKTIAMSCILSAVIGIVLMTAGLICAKPLLILLDTPNDILGNATIYLRTMIAGILIVTAYNMSSAILRAFGDGKSPLIAMVIAALLNIGLDLLFVMVFKWGIFGAAFASVISQLVSFIYCFCQIKKISCVKLERKTWKIDYKMIKELLLFGIPISLQYIIIALGGMILQSTVNLQGSIFVAGFTAVNKLYGLLESTAISLGSAFATFFAQNYGAGLSERVKKGVRTGEKLCVISSLIVTVIMFITGRYLLQIFLDVSKDGGAEAFVVAKKYLFYMIGFLFILYLIYVYKNALQAMGNSIWSMISGIAEFLVRVFMGKIVVQWLGTNTLFFIEPAAWLGALIFVMFPYYILRDKLLSR